MRHDTKPTEQNPKQDTVLAPTMSESGHVLVTRIVYRSTEKSRKKAANRRKRRDRMKAMAAERGLITKIQVASILEVSTRTIERLLLLGRFPPPLRFDRYPRWREAEILEWNAAGRPATNWNQYFKNKAGEMQ